MRAAQQASTESKTWQSATKASPLNGKACPLPNLVHRHQADDPALILVTTLPDLFASKLPDFFEDGGDFCLGSGAGSHYLG